MACEFQTEQEQTVAAKLVGKTCEAVITNLRVGMNGKVELLGTLTEVKS